MAGLLGVAGELRSGQSMEWHTQENWTLQSTGQSRENWPDRRYGAEFALRIHSQPEYGLYVNQTLQGKGLVQIWHSEENQTNTVTCGQHCGVPLYINMGIWGLA